MDIDKIIAQVTEQVMRGLELQKTADQYDEIPLETVSSRLEHSLLDPALSLDRILKGCYEARQYRLANICVNPYFAPFAVEQLRNSGVAVCVPVGFPQAHASTASKVTEIKEAIQNGATELDVSLNMAAIKSGRYDDARKDLDLMLAACGNRAKFKAIYEQAAYTEDEKVKVLTMIKNSGCDFMKISNAFTGKKAAEEDVMFVRSVVGNTIGIKIDGGVKTLEKAMSLFRAGATRIGLTAALKICDEAKAAMHQ